MSWSTAVSDLRVSLSDGPQDKVRYRKTLLGKIDGVNKFFRTLEFRRITDFKTGTTPMMGIWLDGILQATTAIANDFPDSGDVELTAAPANGVSVEASYYIQWFTDSELAQFLRMAANMMVIGDDYSNIQLGLRPAAMAYAKGDAYEKLSLRWAEKLSETFVLEESPDKDKFTPVESYAKQAKDLKAAAYKMRDDFYARAGQGNSPASASISGRVRDIAPKR